MEVQIDHSKFCCKRFFCKFEKNVKKLEVWTPLATLVNFIYILVYPIIMSSSDFTVQLNWLSGVGQYLS